MPSPNETIQALGDELGVRRDREGLGGLLLDHLERRAGRLSGDYDARVARALTIKNLLEEQKARAGARDALLSDAALTDVNAAPAERTAFKPGTGFDLPLPPSGAGDFAANEAATYNTLSRELSLDQAVAKNEPRVQALRRAFNLSDAGIEPGDVRTGALLDATNATRGNPFLGADIANDKSVFESTLEPVSMTDPATGKTRQVYAIKSTKAVRPDGSVVFSFEPARSASGDYLDVPPEELAAAAGRRGGPGGSKPTAAMKNAQDLFKAGVFKTYPEALAFVNKVGVDPAKLRAAIATRLAGQPGFGRDIDRTRSAIDVFQGAAGAQPAAAPSATAPATAPVTATDPRTGRRIQVINGQWQEVR
jgi:hypothetical protein